MIVNKLSADPELLTPFTHIKKEQQTTQDTYGYYEALIANNEPVNFENFNNPQYKYWK